MKVELTLGKVLGIIAVPGGLAGALAGWHFVGWMTPESHDHDLEVQQVAQTAQYAAITEQLKANRDEWWCDEESEYLDDLLAAKDAGDTSAWVEQEILEQRDKMEKTNCVRFDKD